MINGFNEFKAAVITIFVICGLGVILPDLWQQVRRKTLHKHKSIKNSDNGLDEKDKSTHGD